MLSTVTRSRPVSSFKSFLACRTISVQSLLHGSPEAREAGEREMRQHSKLVARGKYIHGFEVHRVKPDALDAYKKAAEEYYLGIRNDPELHVKLSGNWETIVGEQDTFFHILEYENFAGYDKTSALVRQSEKHTKAYQRILPHLRSRSSHLSQEFAFLPTIPPRSQGGIFELRSYQLIPGTLLEWESTWRRGIEARRKYVAPVGAWFSQVGRLNQVHHLWQYPSLESRKEMREKAWQTDGWAETVSKTAQLAKVFGCDLRRKYIRSEEQGAEADGRCHDQSQSSQLNHGGGASPENDPRGDVSAKFYRVCGQSGVQRTPDFESQA